ncbi:DUF167 domain-containing protein [Ferrovum sp. PN-J185]|uniref:DUF167 domain-containing protein n=1 Tax=Ferrovum sp. PN-J185 TaxID=1356306 RepID=UPI00079235D2|nr:DUF167 domain-containing protein [Ferrovum sp. PN-J185]KXW56895.1 hypothetical protein FV185_08580 [Ferrovum sp. PN-J185]MCC6069237.1 DUF167 domain-containing protein [Ferrovum sp. PN-J185]MDE1891461.1 YggU family protein [Betaproteobacteria bacterium]MDE2056013.1 YggU family protein [Betaproteobacteria bacterium]
MKDESLFLMVYVQPGASKSELSGLFDGNIKIRLKAPAVEGQANKALIDFLAEHLDLPKKDIEIVSGMQSRLKRVKFYKSSPKIHQLLLSPR